MEDLLIRLIDKKTVVYLDYYDVGNLYICKPKWLSDILGDDDGSWALNVSGKGKETMFIEKFETEDAAKLALHNVSRALAFQMKYITLLPDGSIEERI